VGNCFELLQATTIHFTLAFVFFSLAMYGLTKPGPMWRLLVILSAVAVVSTHEFTGIVSTAFFAFATFGIVILARSIGFKRGQIESAVMRMPALMVTLTFAWLAFVAFPFFGSAVALVGFILATLLSGTARVVLPLGSNVPNSWEQVLGDVSVLTFTSICAFGFVAILVRREKTEYRQFLPYALSSTIIFFVGFVSYLRFHQSTDLLLRGFLYVYFFSAPVALFAVRKVSFGRQNPNVLRQALGICLILIIVLGGLYTLYPRSTIDNSAPWNIEDVRFPLFQWRAAGYFVNGHVLENTLWGDKIAFDFVGGYGYREVDIPSNNLNTTFSEWLSTVPSSGDIIILRQSIPNVQYASYQVTSPQLHAIIDTRNVIYSSGEVVMVEET